MRVAERVHRDARDEVEVGAALVIPYTRALAADERERLPAVRRHVYGGVASGNVGHGDLLVGRRSRGGW